MGHQTGIGDPMLQVRKLQLIPDNVQNLPDNPVDFPVPLLKLAVLLGADKVKGNVSHLPLRKLQSKFLRKQPGGILRHIVFLRIKPAQVRGVKILDCHP